MKTGIIGCGTMGSGIAQVAASAGRKVKVFDVNAEALKQASLKLEKILNRLIEKERINSEKKEAILSNIIYTSKLNDLADSELIIEAIIENPSVKKNLFSELEELISDSCIVSTNTSSLSVTSLASSLSLSGRFLGIHFFNPAPLMKLVEIIPAVQTEPEIVSSVKQEIEAWGKLTVQAKDTPGFIVNKVARPFYSEAIRIYEEGIADFATIDWAMKKLGGFRMGPFELMDFIGNDINYTVTETVFKAFYYDSRYRPAFTQKRLTEAGYLGRKSGKGYYDYRENSSLPQANEDEALGFSIARRIVCMLINEAADTLHFNIASREDIELAMTKGVNYPKGLFAWAEEIGLKKVVSILDGLFKEYHEERYRCSVLLRKLAKKETRPV